MRLISDPLDWVTAPVVARLMLDVLVASDSPEIAPTEPSAATSPMFRAFMSTNESDAPDDNVAARLFTSLLVLVNVTVPAESIPRLAATTAALVLWLMVPPDFILNWLSA